MIVVFADEMRLSAARLRPRMANYCQLAGCGIFASQELDCALKVSHQMRILFEVEISRCPSFNFVLLALLA
ncbi:hypothetical protein GCM10027170_09150 [Aliiglaciecola aliphaticivorans]